MKHLLWPITLCMAGGGIKLLSSCVSAWCVTKLFHESNLPLRSKGAGIKCLREKALGKQPFGRVKFNTIEVTCTCNTYWPEKQNMAYRPRRNWGQYDQSGWTKRVITIQAGRPLGRLSVGMFTSLAVVLQQNGKHSLGSKSTTWIVHWAFTVK